MVDSCERGADSRRPFPARPPWQRNDNQAAFTARDRSQDIRDHDRTGSRLFRTYVTADHGWYPGLAIPSTPATDLIRKGWAVTFSNPPRAVNEIVRQGSGVQSWQNCAAWNGFTQRISLTMGVC